MEHSKEDLLGAGNRSSLLFCTLRVLYRIGTVRSADTFILDAFLICLGSAAKFSALGLGLGLVVEGDKGSGQLARQQGAGRSSKIFESRRGMGQGLVTN
ncbi:Hypothetical protein DEACI_3349 [Acididesulfobacillus acetoxydans]|uniref:Uncharacterized protein n=1 Tax=Acididesulfobacillus acetoxydans TaxID=1561005 RepID=A0A8S0X6M4_9FIRM|nr:hypothetical protein [Acididesulfobacillus acetoxydans]CAA7602670.1 Hypothetical protein DEACI_3349 [Acididesulfobacillus acetoxydans]CEJ09143.1 Hypothetical protein DEACI_3626 [Acididesulfobacillus acetoxydans]